jgi:hypothetical protein
MIDRLTKQFMSKNRTKTQKHTETLLLLIGSGVYQLVGVPPSSAVVAAVVAVGAAVVEEVAAGSPVSAIKP